MRLERGDSKGALADFEAALAAAPADWGDRRDVERLRDRARKALEGGGK